MIWELCASQGFKRQPRFASGDHEEGGEILPLAALEMHL